MNRKQVSGGQIIGILKTAEETEISSRPVANTIRKEVRRGPPDGESAPCRWAKSGSRPSANSSQCQYKLYKSFQLIRFLTIL
jgi:hypothetical protein